MHLRCPRETPAARCLSPELGLKKDNHADHRLSRSLMAQNHTLDSCKRLNQESAKKQNLAPGIISDENWRLKKEFIFIRLCNYLPPMGKWRSNAWDITIAPVAKPRWKLESTSSCNAIYTTQPGAPQTSTSQASRTLSQAIQPHSALITDGKPSSMALRGNSAAGEVWRISSTSSISLSPTLSLLLFPVFLLSFHFSYLSRYNISTTACLRAPCNKLIIFFKKKECLRYSLERFLDFMGYVWNIRSILLPCESFSIS